MSTFNFLPLIVGALAIVAKTNALVEAYLAEGTKKSYSIKEKIGKIIVLEIESIGNTLACWNGQVRSPMCSLIALFNSLLLKGVKITASEFLEKGVKKLPEDGFLVQDHVIREVFSNLKKHVSGMKDLELVVCNRASVNIYAINENSVVVWCCNEDKKNRGDHFTATVVVNDSKKERKISPSIFRESAKTPTKTQTQTQTERDHELALELFVQETAPKQTPKVVQKPTQKKEVKIVPSYELALRLSKEEEEKQKQERAALASYALMKKLQKEEDARVKQLKEEQDVIRKMYPDGY